MKKKSLKKKQTLRKENKIQGLILAIFTILLITSAIVSNYQTDCKEDINCFNRAFSTCSPAKVVGYENNNLFEYEILERNEESCIVQIELKEVNPQLDEETKEKFQDKSMVCALPISEGFSTSELNFCQGTLKETIYELTIQKMYNLLAQNLGEIISEMRT
ncbi:hypothetical protein HON86_03080 [Candidatus Woesearchaeota archaeon]|jgi:hypothetical protein|nr:hypothetical protein [Candidatus Woesearchaeota archaeon]MBT4835573.1 hypothetical protein [Candidatus Woesearchaeota archaeon]MBT6734937.1 hypothetical protein [Candidatus Woesearchaeota archaeon]MBT7169766.1 hypothetical protein [Candidatus Woesearchaeota archaeon]MBT7474430.1 hypothetical protein [Candidatus Woesearchaeota archaeon]